MNPPPMSRKTLIGPLAVSAVYWAAALLLPSLQDVALNDDWAYASAVRALFQRGSIELPIWATPSLIIQAMWGALFNFLFGPGYGPLRLSTLMLGWVGVLAFHDLVRQDGHEKSPGLDGLLALLFAFNPLFFVLCPSFMTDVPALSLSLIALALSRRALNGGRCDWRWLAMGSAFAALSYGIRQTAILIPAGLTACYWRASRRDRRILWAVWALPLAAVACQLAWRQPAQALFGNTYLWIWEMQPDPWRCAILIAQRIAASLAYCGLFSIPLAAAFWWGRPLESVRRVTARRWYPVMAVSALLALFLLCGGWLPYSPFPGDGRLAKGLFHECNYISRWGLGCFNINGMEFRPWFFVQSGWFWGTITALSWVSLATLGAALAAGPIPPAGILAALTLAPQFAVTLLGAYFFDRYILALVPVALLCGRIAAGSRLRSRIALGIAALPLALFSWAGTADYLRATASAWKLGQRAVEAGLPPGEIHADMDWCWAHNERKVFNEVGRRASNGRIPADETSLSCMSAPRAVVTFKPPPRLPHELMASERFFSPLSLRAEWLHLYRRASSPPSPTGPK